MANSQGLGLQALGHLGMWRGLTVRVLLWLLWLQRLLQAKLLDRVGLYGYMGH